MVLMCYQAVSNGRCKFAYWYRYRNVVNNYRTGTVSVADPDPDFFFPDPEISPPENTPRPRGGGKKYQPMSFGGKIGQEEE